MNRVEMPAYRIDIRVNAGAWADVSTAVQGAPSLSWELEESTGRLISDQLTVRCYVEFLDDCGLAVKDILDADDLGVRVAVFETGRALSPGRGIVFRGRADEVARLSTHAPGDTLDITVLDLLASQSDTVAPASTVDSAPARYTDLLDQLAGAVGLTVAESPPLSLEGDDPVISHHPSPSGDPTIEVRGLAWWANESLLVCGVGERIYAYDPATGQSYELAVPDWPLSTSPPRSIDRLWISGDDLYGVALTTVDAGLTAESYIVKADLSSWSRATMSPTPVAYTAYEDAPLRLYNAGRVKIEAKEVQFYDRENAYLAWAQVIGAAGPERPELGWGLHVIRDDNFYVAPRRWEVRYYGAPPGYDYTTVEPGYAGRNLYLADETEVAVEYEGTGRRQADVVCYRQPGPLGYYVPSAAVVSTGGSVVEDIGNGRPDAERVGALPLTLPPGYYSFISAGQGHDPEADDEVAERVDGFSIVFSQPQRRVEAVKTDAADNPLTAEDDVDPALFDKPLGPLVAVGNDEFERLYIRDVSEGDRVAVTGFPANAYDIHLARAADDEVYCVFARDDGLVGAYGRTEPLVETEVGVCRGAGASWTYQRLYTLSGWDNALADNEAEHSHYRPTCIAYAAGKLYFGVVETVQRFVDAGVRVHSAYTSWTEDDGDYYAGEARILIEGHHVDDFEVGQRIRLWPDQPELFAYAPLPRTIINVDWTNDYGGEYRTLVNVEPFLDVTSGELDPDERVITRTAGETQGIEEYRADNSLFEWGAPTIQHEAAREQRTRFYRLDLTTLAGLTEVDNGQVETTETVTPEVDGDRAVIELGNAYPTDVVLTLGSSAVISTLDEDARDKTGTGRVYLSRRYAGLELTATYNYYDPALRLERALAVGETCYYTKGKKLLDTAGNEYGDVHYQASGVVSPLVIAPTPPLRLYGVAEGGGGLLFQLSRRLSGFVGDRTGWANKPVPSCLSELALALGCVFWVDADGGLHFVPRGWRRNRHVIAATEITDYTEPGAWQVPASAVTVSWPGGEATVGSLSATRAVVNESFTADLVTSAGWAGLLADHLHERLTGSAYRAEATLRDIRLDIEVGDGVQLALTGAISVDDGIGTVVGMSIAPGQTMLTVGV